MTDWAEYTPLEFYVVVRSWVYPNGAERVQGGRAGRSNELVVAHRGCSDVEPADCFGYGQYVHDDDLRPIVGIREIQPRDGAVYAFEETLSSENEWYEPIVVVTQVWRYERVDNEAQGKSEK